jgi:hypothetical protein
MKLVMRDGNSTKDSSQRKGDTAKYPKRSHPAPYILSPNDLWLGLGIMFYVGFILGVLCMAILAFHR